MSITIRTADENDLVQLTSIINEIIEIGGTTAFEKTLSEDQFRTYYITGQNCISCLLAEDNHGLVVGFQSLSSHPELPDSWADIATFARVNPKSPGVGTKLFQETLEFARCSKIEYINAKIREDNKSGLGYYSKMGFETYSVEEKVPLQDGTPVNRISKKFEVSASLVADL